MSASEKAKARIGSLKSRYSWVDGLSCELDQILSALEVGRPEENAGDCAERCIDVWLGSSTDRRNETADTIQSLAESYHKAKCAECKDRCLRAAEICEDRCID